VEARLKGSGMHWADCHVDPMVALRTIACSDRWEEAWPEIERRLRAEVAERAATRRATRRARREATGGPDKPVEALAEAAVGEGPVLVDGLSGDVLAVASVAPSTPQTSLPVDLSRQAGEAKSHRPAANHPWRHMPIGRARRR
jgi:hypothetical protein